MLNLYFVHIFAFCTFKLSFIYLSFDRWLRHVLAQVTSSLTCTAGRSGLKGRREKIGIIVEKGSNHTMHLSH